MRTSRWLLVCALASLLIAPFACSGDDGNNNPSMIQCSDKKDNDGDGDVDFPADLGCSGEDDESEDSSPSPMCKDGRDNDGDGKIDYPRDPGCFAEQQDSEDDDCPDGANCSQCSDGMDNDMNGQTDYPNDNGGCAAASDNDEYTQNPVACGSNVMIRKLPFDGKKSDTLMAGAASSLTSSTCGGTGTEHVYEVRVLVPKVIVATTDNDLTTADTVLYLRTEDCTNVSTEVMCHDNVTTTNKQSTLTMSISTPGTYYLVVDSKDPLGGEYELSVKYYIGEGTTCLAPDECGPGLVCRVPKGATGKICTKHICEDGLDEDGDGKNDYPDDPGCTSLIDDDETDTCPGAGCPECADTVDNDTDGLTDYGSAGDPTCTSASSASEACISTDGVILLTSASTMGTTVGAVNDVKPTCTTTSTITPHSAPDKTYRLDLPPMSELTIDNVNTFSGAMALYDSTCGTELICDNIANPERLTMTNLAAGAYYYVVDGYSNVAGAFTINVSGKIQNGQRCDGVLATAGAITCGIGYACVGATTKTCQPAMCFDADDNDNDMETDFPFDPGCDSPGDNSETDPGSPPVCANNADDDGDGQIDYPADYGCAAAGSNSEAFCAAETDATSKITTRTTMGDTTMKTHNYKNSCSSSSNTGSLDVAHALTLPVAVATLQVDTNGALFDTTIAVRSLDCLTELGCDDEGGTDFGDSLLTLTGVAPGGYAITVEGWSTTGKGVYPLNVQGTVAPGTVCSSPLFTGGASAVLLCPSGTTCKGTPTPKCSP